MVFVGIFLAPWRGYCFFWKMLNMVGCFGLPWGAESGFAGVEDVVLGAVAFFGTFAAFASVDEKDEEDEDEHPSWPSDSASSLTLTSPLFDPNSPTPSTKS